MAARRKTFDAVEAGEVAEDAQAVTKQLSAESLEARLIQAREALGEDVTGTNPLAELDAAREAGALALVEGLEGRVRRYSEAAVQDRARDQRVDEQRAREAAENRARLAKIEELTRPAVGRDSVAVQPCWGGPTLWPALAGVDLLCKFAAFFRGGSLCIRLS